MRARTDGTRRGRHRTGRGGRLPRWAVRAVQVVAVVVSVSAFSGIAYAWSSYRSIDASVESIYVPALHQPPVGSGAASGPSGSSGPSTRPGPGVAQNILLVGVDSRAGLTRAQERRWHLGADPGTVNTDVIMLVHIPADGERARIVSIPRDTFVHIGGGWLDNKINAAYPDAVSELAANASPRARTAAGADLLIKTVEQLTGVTPNEYVQVGFAGFEQIANVVGSMPVNLCESVDDQNSGFHMSAGRHTLDALQMLEFVRQRDGLPGGDIDREKRQEYFLKTAFAKVLSPAVLSSPSRLRSLVSVVEHSFRIDGFADLAEFADQMSSLTSANIDGTPIPTVNDDATRVIGGRSEDVVLVNPAQVRRFVAAQFAAADHPAARSATPPGTGRHRHAATPSCID